MRTYQEVKKAVLNQGFRWFSAPYSLNNVWERTSNVITNKFTDFRHICWLDDKGVEHILSLPATTKPGLYKSILEPVTVNGITGTAVIKFPQQVIGGWQFRDTNKEFSHYPYFRQVKPADYLRDGDKDNMIDEPDCDDKDKYECPEVDDSIFGTHWHIMSRPGTYGSGLVNNWSKGCCGQPEPEYEKTLEITRKSAALYGNKFTGTFLKSEHFK